MLETVRAWLNGNRDYYAGVVIYQQVKGNTALYALFQKGKTDYTKQRLEKELRLCFDELKLKDGQLTNILSSDKGVSVNTTTHRISHEQDSKIVTASAANNRSEQNEESLLYTSAKKSADKQYKALMNKRAQLFALAAVDDFSDVNLPDKIAARQTLAINVVIGYQKVSQLYDKADYVLKHGTLPNDGEPEEEADYNSIPEELVKQALDNKRKALNKLKKREQTPERIALQALHSTHIKTLEKRWHLLQPKTQMQRKSN